MTPSTASKNPITAILAASLELYLPSMAVEFTELRGSFALGSLSQQRLDSSPSPGQQNSPKPRSCEQNVVTLSHFVVNLVGERETTRREEYDVVGMCIS